VPSPNAADVACIVWIVCIPRVCARARDRVADAHPSDRIAELSQHVLSWLRVAAVLRWHVSYASPRPSNSSRLSGVAESVE